MENRKGFFVCLTCTGDFFAVGFCAFFGWTAFDDGLEFVPPRIEREGDFFGEIGWEVFWGALVLLFCSAPKIDREGDFFLATMSGFFGVNFEGFGDGPFFGATDVWTFFESLEEKSKIDKVGDSLFSWAGSFKGLFRGTLTVFSPTGFFTSVAGLGTGLVNTLGGYGWTLWRRMKAISKEQLLFLWGSESHKFGAIFLWSRLILFGPAPLLLSYPCRFTYLVLYLTHVCFLRSPIERNYSFS